ncbi:MAG: cation transporter [Endomicrobiales bacterium]|nr:cation transporter [Endomicrobiales bacterium]
MNKNIYIIRRVTIVGLLVNIALAILKFVVGIVGSSQAVVADGVHTLSDVSTDLAIIFGVKYWSAPADEEHPYGHSRIETIITSVIGVLLIAVAFFIGYKALFSMKESHKAHPGLIAFIGAFVSIVIKELMFHWTVNVGKNVQSSALVANAWHHRSDALSSIPVAVAVIIAALNPKWAFVDHIGAIVVSIFILVAAWRIVKPAVFELSDAGAPNDVKEKIEKIAKSNRGVKSIHAVRTRCHGSGIHVDLHIQVDKLLTVEQGHDIAKSVKKKLLEEAPNVLDVIIHIEPYE